MSRSVAMPTPVPLPRVLRSKVQRLELVAGGPEQKVVLRGQRLDSVTAAALVLNGRVLAGPSLRVAAASPGTVEVVVAVPVGFAELDGLQLRLTGRASPIVVPLSILRLNTTRAAAPPPKAVPLKAGRSQASTATTDGGATAQKQQKLRAEPLRRPSSPTPTPALVGLPGPVAGAAVAEIDADLWREPHIQSVPPQGRASEAIEIIGRGLGVPSQPERTQVSFYGGQWHPRVDGDVLSTSYRSVRVDVPRGAVTGTIRVTTPGGVAESPTRFEPLYLLHYAPDIFTPDGGLGFLHFYDSVLFLAYGSQNSLFQVSGEMQTMGFGDRFFTMDAYEQKIDAVVIKTTLRVRISGSNRADRSKIMRSHPLAFTVDGTNVVIDAGFESEGWEYVGEYETQDVLTGEIHWKHFMNVDINDLTLEVTIPLGAGPNRYQPLVIGEITGTTSFSTRLSIFDSPPFEVDETPIKAFIQDDVDAKVYATFNSEGFKYALATAFSRLVLDSPTFAGVPIARYEVVEARDGGFDIRAVLAE